MTSAPALYLSGLHSGRGCTCIAAHACTARIRGEARGEACGEEGNIPMGGVGACSRAEVGAEDRLRGVEAGSQDISEPGAVLGVDAPL